MNQVIDLLLTSIVRFASFLARNLPYSLVCSVLHFLFRVFLLIQPKHLTVGRKNIEIAFPDMPAKEVTELINNHVKFLSRVLADSLRLRLIKLDWVKENVTFPNEEAHAELHGGDTPGILIATGHLGSFELFAHSAGLMGYNLSFIVRNFPFPKLDQWWCKTREHSGNKVIRRKGAYKKITTQLQLGQDVGVLFDQNVTRNRALFPKWFGLEAATTKAIGFAALQSKAPLVVCALAHRGDGKHEILWERCEIESIRDDESLSRDEKLLQITQIASDKFCAMVTKYPEQWFWFHRRWKTRPIKGSYQYS